MYYATKQEAEQAIAKMKGWPGTHPQKMRLITDESQGEVVWMIYVSQHQYVGRDGFVHDDRF